MAKATSTGTSAPAGGSPPAGTDATDRNSVQPARPRERKGAMTRDTDAAGRRSKRSAPNVNSISAVRARGATKPEHPETNMPRGAREKDTRAIRSAPAESERDAPLSAEDHRTVPEQIRQRFIQVGRKYYFPDGARAFTDRGRRLTTPSENTEVIRSLITIAKARGWNEIVVRGTDPFRREAWFAARLMGLEVRGYRPTDVEQARLVRTLAHRQSGNTAGHTAEAQPPGAPANDGRSARAPAGRAVQDLVTGRLIEHGRAPFQHDRHQPMSYFAKIETRQGEQVVWGVDLERAFRESVTKPQVGDDIGLRLVRKDNVTVKATKRDETGKVVGAKDVDTQRNRWIIEKREFFAARVAAAETIRDSRVPPRDAVKAHPELVGTYLQIRAAELAAKRFQDPQDRTRFVETVRAALADSVGRGEPAPRMKLRERTASRPPARAHGARSAEQAPARG